MFLLLDDDKVLPIYDVVAMFDLDIITLSRRERNILAKLQENSRLNALNCSNLPRSLVVSQNDDTILTKFNLKTLMDTRCLSVKFKK